MILPILTDPKAPPNALLAGCPVCGSRDFGYRDVIWQGLADAWQLGSAELAWINRQQGFHCNGCGNNLRMIALADALVRTLGFGGTLSEFCAGKPRVKVLEINTAGFLTAFLRSLPGHRLVEYPAFDMMALDIESGAYDFVLHSDSLEHVRDPVRGLSECLRVLRPGGRCLFTVPLVVGRLSRSRESLPPVHHGREDLATEDQLVRTEFGSDTWEYVLAAGFSSCEVQALEYPSALTFVCTRAGIDR